MKHQDIFLIWQRRTLFIFYFMCMSVLAWMFMSMPGVHRGHKKVSGPLELTIVSHHVNAENKTQILRNSTAILSDLNSWVISLAQQRRNFYKITCNLIQVFWSSFTEMMIEIIFSIFIFICIFACMYVCTTYALSTQKGKKEVLEPWNCILWVLGTKPEFSERALNHKAIFPVIICILG